MNHSVMGENWTSCIGRPWALHKIASPRRKLSDDAMCHPKILPRFWGPNLANLPSQFWGPNHQTHLQSCSCYAHDVDACPARPRPSYHQVLVCPPSCGPIPILTSVNIVFHHLPRIYTCLSTCPNASCPRSILRPLVPRSKPSHSSFTTSGPSRMDSSVGLLHCCWPSQAQCLHIKDGSCCGTPK